MDLNAAELAPPLDGAITPPDDFYYASLYLPSRTRHALRVVEAARRAITGIPGSCSDRGIAHLKLAWWQTEMQQLASGTARHPLAHALLPLLRATPDLLARLEQVLEATISGLNHAPLADRAAELIWLRQQQGALLEYYLAGGAPLSDAQRERLLELGGLVELSYALRDLRQHRRATPLLLPTTALRAAGLSEDAVRGAQRSTELRAVLPAEADSLRAQLLSVSATLPRAVRRGQRLLLTLAACAAEALALTRADDCAVLERRVELLPIRKLWLAWRTAHWG